MANEAGTRQLRVDSSMSWVIQVNVRVKSIGNIAKRLIARPKHIKCVPDETEHLTKALLAPRMAEPRKFSDLRLVKGRLK